MLATRRLNLAGAVVLLNGQPIALARQLRVCSDAVALSLAANDALLLNRLLLGGDHGALVILASSYQLLTGRKLTDAQPGAALVISNPARLGRPLRRMVILV